MIFRLRIADEGVHLRHRVGLAIGRADRVLGGLIGVVVGVVFGGVGGSDNGFERLFGRGVGGVLLRISRLLFGSERRVIGLVGRLASLVGGLLVGILRLLRAVVGVELDDLLMTAEPVSGQRQILWIVAAQTAGKGPRDARRAAASRQAQTLLEWMPGCALEPPSAG